MTYETTLVNQKVTKDIHSLGTTPITEMHLQQGKTQGTNNTALLSNLPKVLVRNLVKLVLNYFLWPVIFVIWELTSEDPVLTYPSRIPASSWVTILSHRSSWTNKDIRFSETLAVWTHFFPPALFFLISSHSLAAYISANAKEGFQNSNI